MATAEQFGSFEDFLNSPLAAAARTVYEALSPTAALDLPDQHVAALVVGGSYDPERVAAEAARVYAALSVRHGAAPAVLTIGGLTEFASRRLDEVSEVDFARKRLNEAGVPAVALSEGQTLGAGIRAALRQLEYMGVLRKGAAVPENEKKLVVLVNKPYLRDRMLQSARQQARLEEVDGGVTFLFASPGATFEDWVRGTKRVHWAWSISTMVGDLRRLLHDRETDSTSLTAPRLQEAVIAAGEQLIAAGFFRPLPVGGGTSGGPDHRSWSMGAQPSSAPAYGRPAYAQPAAQSTYGHPLENQQPQNQQHFSQPAYGQPGFGPPTYAISGSGYAAGYGYPYATVTSGRATTILVLGITGLVLTLFCGIGFIPAIVALCLAPGARREIRDSGGHVSGESQVTTGVILSWITLGITALFVILVAGVLLATMMLSPGDVYSSPVETSVPTTQF